MYSEEILKQGCLDIWIDELVPCLKDTATDESLETVVFRIESRSYLKRYNSKTGWRINWSQIPKDVEVYALALAESNEIEGLIGIKKDYNANALFIHWACTAPHNNLHDFNSQKYSGVGGHLFAIAAEKSFEYGFDGFIHGYAANEELVKHYVEKFGAIHVGAQHQFQIMIDSGAAANLREVYSYEWAEGNS